jgi:hypothetical protein
MVQCNGMIDNDRNVLVRIATSGESCSFVYVEKVDCIVYAKGIIHHKFVPEKQTLNSKPHKDVTERFIARVHHVSE